MTPERPDPQEAVEYGLFSRRQALEAGISPKEMSRLLRRGGWVRLGHGIYQEASRPARFEDRYVLVGLRAGRWAVASHLCAAHVLGWDLLHQAPPLQVTVPRSNGWVDLAGADVFRRDLAASDVCLVGVLRVTTPARTAIDLAADAPLVEAVVAIDSGLRAQHLSMNDLERAVRDRRHSPRRPRAVRVLDLVDPAAGSVPESVARVLFLSAGLVPPLTQYVVKDDDGNFLARVDFAWPTFRLVVEIDGFEWHGGEDAFQSDRDRQNGLELEGWTVLRFTTDDVRDRPEKVTETVRDALSRRGR